MAAFRLSLFLPEDTRRDAVFRQTQFANADAVESICYVKTVKYLHEANANAAIAAVITGPDLADQVDPAKGLAIVDDPECAFYELHNRLFLEHGMAPEMTFGVAPGARVHTTAVVSEKCYIADGAEVGPGAVIEPYSFVGPGVMVGPGAVIGACGHNSKKFDGRMFRVAHAGGVRLEEGAQVLAGAVISKAVHTDMTIVGKGTVVSVRAHIGHGCRTGRNCIIAGGAQISGYTTLGDNVWVGPGAVIGNLLSIGADARIELGSAVVRDVAPGEVVSGNFAYSHVRHVRDHAAKLSK